MNFEELKKVRLRDLLNEGTVEFAPVFIQMENIATINLDQT